MPHDQRRLAAILAADVAGYSRLMAADESATLTLLRRFRQEVIEPRVARFDGRIVGSAGDSLLVEFASAVKAVQCAVEMQEALAKENAALPENGRMVFRMGVNLGDVIAEDNTIHGDGVNVAARLEKLAEPGSVCIGRGVHDQVKGKLAYTYTDLGEHRAHNIPEPVHAYRVGPMPLTSDAPINASSKSAPLHQKPSIAVLPFENMSGFVDGMVEDIITELSRFRSLFVIARNSSFVYKGKAVNVVDAGRALGVRYIAEGSVRRAGNRVRVTAQLIDTQTGSHLWAERFDRELEDIFAVQDEVTRRIVTNIAPLVAAEALQLAKRKPPEDMRAYDYYLKARAIVDSPNSGADLHEALAYCDQAISIDPSYARAYACKALVYVACNWMLELGDIDEWREQALHYGEQAVALDPLDGVSHWALGESTFYLKQYDRCRSHMARSLALNPNDADVLAVSAFLQTACGDSNLGLLHMQMARERNPSHPPWYHWIAGGTLYMMGRFDEALASFDLFGRPNASVRRWRAITLVRLGRIEEARAEVRSLLGMRPGLSIAEIGRVFDYLPDFENYLDCLRQAGLPE